MKNIKYISIYEAERKKINKILSVLVKNRKPASLYEPGSYILNSGGKRLRPLLVLLSAKAVGGEFKSCYNAAAAVYLKRCGFSVKGLDAQTLISLMQESQTVPVQCFVGRTDKAKKDENGKWVNREPRLKTRDFNVGTKEEPVYAESVTVDGVEFQAAPTVVSFSKATIQ